MVFRVRIGVCHCKSGVVGHHPVGNFHQRHRHSGAVSPLSSCTEAVAAGSSQGRLAAITLHMDIDAQPLIGGL